jgi:hypothetical protein
MMVGAATVPITVDAFAGAEASYAMMCAAYQQALDAAPDELCSSYFIFAGVPVRFRIVGRKLADELLRAFSHLRQGGEPSSPPQLDIDLWDESATGIPCPGGLPPGMPGRPEYAGESPDGRFIVHQVALTRTCLDRKRQHVVGWIGAPESLTHFQRGRPLQPMLMRWHLDRDAQPLHAGLVARGDRGALICGASGSGKSSVTLHCFQAGLSYLGDDCVGLMSDAAGRFTGHSLFCSANVTPDHLLRFDGLAPYAIRGQTPVEDKSLLFLADIAPARFTPQATIVAMLLPRVLPVARAGLRPASKREALLRIAPSTLCWVPEATERRPAFERLSRLVDSVPTYWIDLGQDIGSLGRLVDDVLAGPGPR